VFSVINLTAANAGGGVLPVGGASEMTQLANNAQLIEQVKKSTEQIQNQIKMIEDMVRNTKNLPDKFFGEVGNLYNDINGVMMKTKGLAYQFANLDEEMAKKFKSYVDLKKTIKNAPDFQKEYREITTTQRETTRSIVTTLGIMNNDLQNSNEVLKKLREKAMSADGRNQLLTSINQLMAFQSQELMSLRKLLMTQAHITAVTLETERSKGDIRQQEYERYNAAVKTKPGNKPLKADWMD